MLVLHAHWIAPRKPVGSGGVLIWAEDSSAPQPALHHGPLPQRPRPKPHPFQANIDSLKELLHKSSAPREVVLLNLPTSRTGPLPSPQLEPGWHIDHETPVSLAPWMVTGLIFQPHDALPILLDLPILEHKNPGLTLGEDAKYWRIAVTLVIEAIAAQKLVPVMNEGRGSYYARWLPILDSPRDGERLAFMERNMPPVCRSEVSEDRRQTVTPTPRAHLSSFLNALSDSLARKWGWNEMRQNNQWSSLPGARWLAALFREDPTIKGSPAQLQAMESGFRAWIRNLQLAGDSVFRIAFRLEPPAVQTIDASFNKSTPPADWTLHFLLQARDDPSLLVSASHQ
jgi:hypothetical protein